MEDDEAPPLDANIQAALSAALTADIIDGTAAAAAAVDDDEDVECATNFTDMYRPPAGDGTDSCFGTDFGTVATFAEANETCRLVGASLCSADDVVRHRWGWGTGCDADGVELWVDGVRVAAEGLPKRRLRRGRHRLEGHLARRRPLR